MAVTHADSPAHTKFSWIRRALPLAAATLAAFCLVATPAGDAHAQDVPWGKSDKKKPANKQPAKKQAAKKAPAKQAPAKRAPAKQAPAKQAPVKKAATDQPDKPTPETPADQPKVELQDVNLLDHFKKELAPHGTWSKDATHGDVWVPNPATVGKEWGPYRDHGHWSVTDKGQWAWVSDMKWGKIPFHYGRWTWSPKKNWMWVPGTEHAPAWVVWRVADSNRKFVGWAPMAPETKGDEKTVLPYYFAPTRYLFSPHVDKFVIANKRLAKKMFDHSHVFGGHAVPVAEPEKKDSAAKPAKADKASASKAADDGAVAKDAKVTATKTGMQAASPTFKDVAVPAFAMPKTKLDSNDEAIAPVLGLLNAKPDAAVDDTKADDATGSDSTSRFATPPPPEKAKKRRYQRSRKARKARRHRSWSNNKARYRCWWTNTRPRIWRCGY